MSLGMNPKIVNRFAPSISICRESTGFASAFFYIQYIHICAGACKYICFDIATKYMSFA